MPKVAMDYSNTVIYKIQHCEKEDLIYVGFTTNFSKRKHRHKCNCTLSGSSHYNTRVYKMIRENGGWEMFNMIPVKSFPCENRREAIIEEDRIMLELRATMNQNRASRGWREYVQDNIEAITARKTAEVNCICGASISQCCYKRHLTSQKHLKFISL